MSNEMTINDIRLYARGWNGAHGKFEIEIGGRTREIEISESAVYDMLAALHDIVEREVKESAEEMSSAPLMLAKTMLVEKDQ